MALDVTSDTTVEELSLKSKIDHEILALYNRQEEFCIQSLLNESVEVRDLVTKITTSILTKLFDTLNKNAQNHERQLY